MTDRQLLQAFRRRSMEGIFNIPALPDIQTGKHIILWKDIVTAFDNAKSVWCGNSLVPFLTDQTTFQWIYPLRILYHPDDVLEVDTRDQNQAMPVVEPCGDVTVVVGSSSRQETSIDVLSSSGLAVQTKTGDIAAMTISASISQGLYPSFVKCEELLEGQRVLACSVNQIMEQLQVENAKNKERWERLTQTQETILRNQDQALNQLNVIQGRIQAVVTQTFELHEFSIPRLFIVLPKSLRLVDKLKGVFSDQFRLYFLCECGKHTTSDGTKQRHHIHLAKHEGYDLERPTAFFEKYGLYVRTVMQMIKIGISTAGLFLPPLNAPKLIDNIDAEKHMGFIKTNFSSLIDDSIAFLDDNLKSTEASDELIDGDTYFDQLEALEGANLRQLESYLKLKDQERVLGNLFRIVTSEGHVKWVCSDHYQASYRASALEQLQDVIKVNLGKYIEKRGRIEIEIASSALAKQFYDAMAKARGIQELEITLKWDVTMDDLRKLSKAVTNANVHRLTMDGSHFKTPALDIVNIHRRFDPIVSSIARTHSFYLKGFEDFFARVSTLPAAPMPNLRVLSIDCGILLDKKAIRSLNGLLERCPALTVLELGLCDRDSMIVASSDRIKMPPTLKSLKLNHGGLFVNARLTEGQIQGAILTVDRLDRLSVDDLKFIRNDCPSKLAIKYTYQVGDENRLPRILKRDITHIRTRCRGDIRVSIAATPQWQLQELEEMTESDPFMRLESRLIENRRLSLASTWDQGGVQDLVMTVKQLASLSLDDTTFIRSHVPWLVILGIPRADEDVQLASILEQNLALVRLQVVCTNILSCGVTRECAMKIQDILRTTTSGSFPKLESVRIDYGESSIDVCCSQGTVQDTNLTIGRLGDLYSEPSFVQKDDITRLAIKFIPQEENGGQLINVLRHSPRLSHLQIGCETRNLGFIVSLLISTRDAIIQEHGSSSLLTVELMGENLVPFNTLAACYRETSIQSILIFQANSNSFDMRTWIRLQDRTSIRDEDPVYDFIRQYFWSIVFFDENITFNDTFAAILDDVPVTKNLQLQSLVFRSDYLAMAELDRLDGIVNRSPNFKGLGLNMDLNDEDCCKTALSILNRHRAIVSKIQLTASASGTWSCFASSFTSRKSLPTLESFALLGSSECPPNLISWFVAMVSIPSRELDAHRSSPQQDIVGEQITCLEPVSTRPWTPLKEVMLCLVTLQPDEWTKVIEAIDFSVLECLSFRATNFSRVQFTQMIERLSKVSKPSVPLNVLDIRNTKITRRISSQDWEEMLSGLRKKAPLAKIICRG